MKTIWLLLVLFMTIYSNNQENFLQANLLYKQQKFQEALDLYQKLPQSWAVCYNIGHCYFALQDYAQSLRWWYKAGKYGAWKYYKPIRHNCRIAQQKLGLESQDSLRDKLYWAIICMPLFCWQLLFLCILFAGGFFLNKLIYRRAYWCILLYFFVLLLIGQCIWLHYKQTALCGIVGDTIELTAGTDQHFNKIGKLYKGQQVIIVDQQDEWVRVSIDKLNGWVPAACIAVI